MNTDADDDLTERTKYGQEKPVFSKLGAV